MRIILIGKGKMGTIFKKIYRDEIIANVDTIEEIEALDLFADVVIDFSHPSLLDSIISFVKKENIPLLIATTGYTLKQETKILELSKIIPICKDSNFSMGISKIKEMLHVILDNFDGKIDMLETHHIHKLDAPSGTALAFRKIIKGYNKDVKIISVRKGDEIGKHHLKFICDDEIIEIKHTALNKDLFIKGAYLASEHLIKKNRGLYSFKEVIDE